MIKPATGRSGSLLVVTVISWGRPTDWKIPRKRSNRFCRSRRYRTLLPAGSCNCIDPKWDAPILLRVSGWTSVLHEDLSDEGITTSMREAVRLAVCAVALSIFVGTAHERQTLLNLAKLVDEGEDYGMPVMAITAVGKELEKRDARYLSLACRIAAELGVQVVKRTTARTFPK